MNNCIDCEKELKNYYAKRCGSCSKKGELHPSFKDGRSLIQHYCIDCGEEICWKTAIQGHGRCRSCAFKKRIKEKGHPRFKYGKTLKKHYCMCCGKELRDFRSKRCKSCAMKERFKNPKDCPNYIEGLNREYPLEFNDELREIIRNRDNYTCQNCGMIEEEHLIVYDRVLSVHHIDYDKENLHSNNLITLCLKCHTKTNYNRDYWYAYCQYIMEN